MVFKGVEIVRPLAKPGWWEGEAAGRAKAGFKRPRARVSPKITLIFYPHRKSSCYIN